MLKYPAGARLLFLSEKDTEASPTDASQGQIQLLLVPPPNWMVGHSPAEWYHPVSLRTRNGSGPATWGLGPAGLVLRTPKLGGALGHMRVKSYR